MNKILIFLFIIATSLVFTYNLTIYDGSPMSIFAVTLSIAAFGLLFIFINKQLEK